MRVISSDVRRGSWRKIGCWGRGNWSTGKLVVVEDDGDIFTVFVVGEGRVWASEEESEEGEFEHLEWLTAESQSDEYLGILFGELNLFING